MRLTDKNIASELAKKQDKTKEEAIYLTLSNYENASENKELFTKRQLNNAITKAMEMLVSAVKVNLTKEIVKTMTELIKTSAIEGKVDIRDVELMGQELIKRVEGAK